jgi:3-oxoacyl-[acyl-carrier protein] reductase
MALDGRVALVTGASRRIGIGAAVVRRLVDDGVRVLVHGWSAHDAEQPWGADPDAVVDIEADLADPDVPARLVDATREAYGRLDIVVANHARSSRQALEALTAKEIDLSYAVNTRSTLLLVKAFAAQYGGGPGGRVVLFTSGQYHNAMPEELPYIASKGALHQVTRSLAVHLMPRGITVNCIDPGPNDTGYAGAEAHAWVAERSPGKRWGTPTDAARLVGWLVSGEADWVTGQVIASDGGWSAL